MTIPHTTASGAADRVNAYLDRRATMRSVDPEVVHGIDGPDFELTTSDLRALAASAPVAPTPKGFVQAPHYRGYANLGTGQYVLNHTAPHEPAELIISIATEEDKAGRTIGDDRGNPAGKAIQPDEMAVRLAFTSVAGLDALEKQLRYLREVHFPQAAPVAPAPQQGEYLPLPVRPEPDGFLTIKIIGRDVEVNGYRDSTLEEFAHAAIDADRAHRAAQASSPSDAEQAAWHAELDEGRSQARGAAQAAPTAQEARVPLSSQECRDMLEEVDPYNFAIDLIRAVERHHGITAAQRTTP